MKKTYLNHFHKEHGGYMVDFSGWEMPLHYGSQLTEHLEVRSNVGIFDVSHMAVFDLTGPEQQEFLRFLLPNDVAKISGETKALYSPLLDEDGGILDDLIVYSLGQNNFRIISNCATREQNYDWLRQWGRQFAVDINFRPEDSIISLQGPSAHKHIKRLTNNKIAKFELTHDQDMMISGTGYTGENGYEIVSDAISGTKIWDQFISDGIKPIGLAARDTLRLEAGLNLFGADMTKSNSPYDSNIAWTVDLNDKNRDFIGKQALTNVDKTKVLTGFYTEERGVLRSGAVVRTKNCKGIVTSGTWSPTFKKNIGFCRIEKNHGDIGTSFLRDKEIDLNFCNNNFLKSLT